jgi:hypothetical protein
MQAVDAQTGISMRFVEQYRIDRDQMPHRFDVLCGVPDLAFHPDAFAFVMKDLPLPPAPLRLPLPALVALGAAAVIANPRPLSRRDFFRLGARRG